MSKIYIIAEAGVNHNGDLKIATGMAVHLVGGKPVFAEISASTPCLDVEDVKRRVTQQTADVILVHMPGLITPDIFAFRQFCDERGLKTQPTPQAHVSVNTRPVPSVMLGASHSFRLR
jgi:hypothetical protein